jgi:spore germination cell wall hydrolase CwlJ-like protein
MGNKGQIKYKCILIMITVIISLFLPPSALIGRAETGSRADYLEKKTEIKEKENSARAGQKKAHEKLDSLKKQQSELKDNVSDINDDFSSVTSDVRDMQSKINSANNDIKDLSRKLEETEKKAEEQKKQINERIVLLYESSVNDTFFTSLINSGSLVQFVSRASYVSDMKRYDDEMINKYQDLKKQISDSKSELADRKSQLNSYSSELSEKQKKLDSALAKARSALMSKVGQVNEAQLTADQFDSLMASYEAEEKQLDALYLAYAEEESMNIFGGTGSIEETMSDIPYAVTGDETKILATIIQAEAGNQPEEGKLAVGSVIMNRVASSHFPNTISGVVFSPRQFSPVDDGHFQAIYNRGPNQDCIDAAQKILSGYRNVPYLFFTTVSVCESRGFPSANMEYLDIGAHRFWGRVNWNH